MQNINDWLKHIAHDYILVIIAAVLFFTVKAVIGWYTFRHYDKKLKELTDKVNSLLEQSKTN